MMEKQKRKSLDMLHGSMWNKLRLFALPVAAVGSYFDFYCNTGRNRRRHCRGIGCESLTVIPSGAGGCLSGSSALSKNLPDWNAGHIAL